MKKPRDLFVTLVEWVDGPMGEGPRGKSRFWNTVICIAYWLTGAEPWQYFFGAPHAMYETRYGRWHYFGNPVVTYCKTVWCRLRGHPAGQVFYNPGGTEPDESCRNCGEACL